MSRFSIIVRRPATITKQDVELRVSGEGFGVFFEGREIAYSLSENALVEWALYTHGAKAVHHNYDLREVEERGDGKR